MSRLTARRCARHREREAVARCPGCGEYFCRECVVEHGGRLLCARCLEREGAQAGPRSQRRQRAARALMMAVGAAVLWMFFDLAGTLLARIPPDVHEGTVWRRAFERNP